jgi:FAD/FMN-containing dehydrogenase
MTEAFIPRSRAELAEWLRARTSPVSIRGSQSRGHEGDIVMSGLSSLKLYEPGEMIVQVEAGMTISHLDQILSEKQQWIPTLVPNEDESTTIGGALAHDSHHPRAENTMTLRTTVLGGTFCTTDGTLFRSGSRVVKSVAGYDTHRAFVGSNGAFGVIVEVTLRVLPRPERIIRFKAPSEIVSTIRSCAASVLVESDRTVLAELSGYEEDVEESFAKLNAEFAIELMADEEWAGAIRKVRNNYHVPAIEPNAKTILRDLANAFDPKGLLSRE